MEINSIVILTLNSPKEKIWGQLQALHPAGVTVRGIDINSFDDFVRQIINREDAIVGMATIFFPCTGWSASRPTSPAARCLRSPTASFRKPALRSRNISVSISPACEGTPGELDRGPSVDVSPSRGPSPKFERLVARPLC